MEYYLNHRIPGVGRRQKLQIRVRVKTTSIHKKKGYFIYYLRSWLLLLDVCIVPIPKAYETDGNRKVRDLLVQTVTF